MYLEKKYSKNASRTFIMVLIIITGFTLNSCRSSKQNNTNQLNEKEISHTLNIPISKKDNIFLYREAALWLNTPHRDGGCTKSGIDCSYLAYIIYREVYYKQLERSSNEIYKKNCNRIGKHQLKEGDLVFFNTLKSRKSQITHIGIYLKDGKFIHTSTTKGVIISDLEEEYYKKTWVCGGRVR